MGDDSKDLASARSRWNARITDSSVIAWICSDAWTRAHYPAIPAIPRLTGVSWSVRGSATYATNGVVSGEITGGFTPGVDRWTEG
jgi:hypothetical protein